MMKNVSARAKQRGWVDKIYRGIFLVVAPGLLIEENQIVSACITALYAMIYLVMTLMGTYGSKLNQMEPSCTDKVNALLFGGVTFLFISFAFCIRHIYPPCNFCKLWSAKNPQNKQRHGLDVCFLHFTGSAFSIHLIKLMAESTYSGDITLCEATWAYGFFVISSIQCIWAFGLFIVMFMGLISFFMCSCFRKLKSNQQQKPYIDLGTNSDDEDNPEI